MLCLNCGKEISDGAKFCPHCGAITAASTIPRTDGAGGAPYTYSYGAVSPSPAPTPPEGTGKGRKKGLLIGGIAAVTVVIAALVAVVAGGLFSNPKGTVELAFAKTAAAYSDAAKGMGLPDMTELAQGRSVSQRLRVELNSINSALTGDYDLSSLSGLGLSMSGDYDQNGRRLGGELAAFWGDNELVSFQMQVDDNILSLASPQFIQGKAYGMDTETLGADLVRLGVEDDGIQVENIGFNIFDLMEETAPSQQNEDLEQKVRDAAKELADAVEVEKNGKKDIEVNGKSVSAAAYHVTIPQEAMEAYAAAVKDAAMLVDSQESTRRILRAVGLDEATINDIMSEMEDVNPYGEMFDALDETLRAMGDVELDVYLDDGYVCAVEYAKEKDGRTLEIGLYMGGGDNYVDDFSMRIAMDGEELLMESSGSHGGKDGVFTDNTVLRLRSGGSDVVRINSSFRYAPTALADNFGWTLDVNNAGSVEMGGQLTAGKDSMNLQLGSVVVRAAGLELCSLAMDYSVGPCREMSVSLPAPTLLGDMDEYDLMDLYYEIEENAQEWVYEMLGMIPMDLLWAFY